MNRRPCAPGSALARLALAALAAAAVACVEVDGGAVELSWSLRTVEGDAVESCGDIPLEAVRICWEPADGASTDQCRPGHRRTFPCGDRHGVTAFEVPPGPTLLWIEPVCPGGAPPPADTYEVPPPILRTVEHGRVVTLRSLLIEIRAGADCEPRCTCRP
jgi:hypothetical protein